MQAEIDASGWAGHVRFLGVNAMGYERGNEATCEGRVIPWLQDVANEHAWIKWGVASDDVVILDALNVPVATFSLSRNSLTIPAHYDSLKALLYDLVHPPASAPLTVR